MSVGVQGTAQQRRITSPINVGDTERRLSIVSGLGLLVAGLRMGGFKGVITVLLAADMIIRGTTGHCWIYRLLGINTAIGSQSGGVAVPHQQGIRAEGTIVIQRPVDEVYDFWRNFENLPQFMNNLASVEVYDETHSKWTAKGPAGINVSWDAEVITEKVDEVIGWRSKEGASVPNAGAVNFRATPDGRGTLVIVKMEYAPPGGAVGELVANILGQDPQKQIESDLRRLKEVLEMDTQPIQTTDYAEDYSGMDHSYTSGMTDRAQPYGNDDYADDDLTTRLSDENESEYP